MTSPRLLHYAERAKIQGSRTVHTYPASKPFLISPDEITIRHAKADRRLLAGIVAWIVFIAVGLGWWAW